MGESVTGPRQQGSPRQGQAVTLEMVEVRMALNTEITGEWYREAFGHQYLEVYPWRNVATAEPEACRAIEWLEAVPGDQFLDLCCGAGRHSVWLKKAGLELISIDLSRDLLEQARLALGPEAVLIHSDVRSLPLPPASVDHVAMFFTSFGYFPTDEENMAVLKEVARVVRAGGGFLLDLPDRDSTIEGLVPSSQRCEGDLHIEEARSISDDGTRVEKQVVLRQGDSVQSYTETVRLYSFAELNALLVASGWECSRVHGSWSGDKYLPGTSERMILVAKRSGEV